MSSFFQVGELVLDPDHQQAFIKGKLIDLRRKEFDILYFLARHQGGVVYKNDLLEYLWDFLFHRETNTLESHIASLRSKIGEQAIKTFYGLGYALFPHSLV